MVLFPLTLQKSSFRQKLDRTKSGTLTSVLTKLLGTVGPTGFLHVPSKNKHFGESVGKTAERKAIRTETKQEENTKNDPFHTLELMRCICDCLSSVYRDKETGHPS